MKTITINLEDDKTLIEFIDKIKIYMKENNIDDEDIRINDLSIKEFESIILKK